MGYTTDFTGSFTLDRPLKLEHAEYLRRFAETRRMKRDPTKIHLSQYDLHDKVGLPLGIEGEYYIPHSPDYFGQERTSDIIDYNQPPSTQPGLWCQWVPTEDLNGIEWDGWEKFYCYAEWLEYIIEHFLKPWGYILNGKVKWFGEDPTDIGVLIIKDNVLEERPIGDKISNWLNE